MSDKIKLSYKEISELLKTIAYLNTSFVIINSSCTQYFETCKSGQGEKKYNWRPQINQIMYKKHEKNTPQKFWSEVSCKLIFRWKI